MSDLKQIAELIKAGKQPEARQQLLQLLHEDRNNEQAWLFMAACATNKSEFEQSLLQVLKLNPFNNQAVDLAQKNKIRLPKEVQAARKRSKKAKKAAAKGERRSRRGLLLFIIVILLLVVVGAVLVQGNQKKETATSSEATEAATEQATEEVTAEAAVGAIAQTATTIAATNAAAATQLSATNEDGVEPATATQEPSATPSPTPSEEPTEEITAEATTEATAEATEEVAQALPTEIPTQQPTPTQESTATPIPPSNITLTLVYNEKVIYIQNVSEVNQDISALVFVQKLDSGKDVRFETTEWYQGGNRGPGTIFGMQPNYCFQLGIDTRSASTKPQECPVLLGWVFKAKVNWFWLPTEGGSDTFLVLQGEVQIAECQVTSSVCEFALP